MSGASVSNEHTGEGRNRTILGHPDAGNGHRFQRSPENTNLCSVRCGFLEVLGKIMCVNCKVLAMYVEITIRKICSIFMSAIWSLKFI